jgi:uncharacterized membrane protein (UPF0127 family)
VILLSCSVVGCAGATETLPDGDPWAVAVSPNGVEFALELADSPEERRVGYMFREEVGPNEGMLFLFERDERHSIWMKNCLVPLDILWLDASYRVLYRVTDAPPCPDEGPCPSMVSPVPARYVLELAAGGADRAELDVGASLVVLRGDQAR